jgi:membrane peptidoglycan carboxypeptidase
VVNANPSWMNGPRNMWSGFGRSVNTYFLPLEQSAGAENAVDVAKRLGIQFRAKGQPGAPSDYEFANNPQLSHTWGPFTLGVSSTTPLDLANAYATVAADGNYCTPTPISEIRDANDQVLDIGKPQCRRAVSEDVARAALDAARCPVGDQSAFGRCDDGTAKEVKGIVGRPVAGKSGTTDGDKTASLVAMTRQVAIAGIVADTDNPLTNRLKGDLGDPHKYVNKAVEYGLKDAMANKPAQNFNAPSKEIAFGKRSRIPGVKCKSIEEAQRAVEKAGFEVTVSDQAVDSDCPAGRVAGTSPSGDTSAGSNVTILKSKGKGGSPKPPGDGGGGPPPPPPENCPIPWFCPRQ